nr:TROVE domain-containing protein [Candidatus Sigynarchaeota archaeon]
LPFILAMQRFNELPIAEYNQEAIDLITKYRIPWNFASSKFGKQKWMWNALAPKMPIMALLMNLRNILEAGADITPVVKQLTTEEKIQHSKLFPFRFLTAYRAVNGNHSTGMPRNFTTIKEKNADPFNVKKVANALKTAMQLALNNMPTFTGRTLIAADNSGSMCKAISDKSEVHLKDIADTFAAMANHIFEDAIVSTFADKFRIVTTSDDKDILENAEKIRGTNVGGSTNGYKVFEYLLTGKEENDDPYQLARRLVSQYNTRHDFTSKKVARNQIPVDRIVIFTDQELWDTKFTTHVFEKYKEYVKATGKSPFVYLVDVGGYGETCFPPGLPNVCMISGWSENLFKFIDQFEKGIGTQVSHIKGLQPGTEMHRDEPEVEQPE